MELDMLQGPTTQTSPGLRKNRGEETDGREIRQPA